MKRRHSKIATRIIVAVAVLGLVGAVSGLALAKPSARKASPPTPKITSHPTDPTKSTTATFAFKDSKSGVSFQCSLDTGAFLACTSAKVYTGLADGKHKFRVRAVQGGAQSGADSWTWTIDTAVPPPPTFTSKPPNPSPSLHASFRYTDAQRGVGFLCKLDGAAYRSCGNSRDFDGLSQGSHTFFVEARDRAGNTSTPASYTWLVDTLPPPTPSFVPPLPPNPSAPGSITFKFTDSESDVAFQCRLDHNDAASFASCLSPDAFTIAVGTHSFDVRAVDGAGNRSGFIRYTWVVQAADPGVPFTITGNASGLLYPGAAPTPIAITFHNPNNVPIYVTGLTVTVVVHSTNVNCDSDNIALAQSNLSSSIMATVPANGTATLPAGSATAPTIQLVNLPTDQNPCKNATFTLNYSGSAHS